MSARSGPVKPSSFSDPPPVITVSGPPICVAFTGPPPESRFAPAIPDTATGPPSVVTVAVTSDGTITAKLTLQSDWAHAGSPRLRWPPDTDCTTAGWPLMGPPFSGWALTLMGPPFSGCARWAALLRLSADAAGPPFSG